MERYGIPGIVLMENAARGLLDHAVSLLKDEGRAVLIICGAGNNGGDGYALARHLSNQAMDVDLVSLGDPRPRSDAAINAAICRCMGLRARSLESIVEADGWQLVVDAIFGTGLTRAVTGDAAQAIDWMNASGIPVLAVDIPSGLDCATGLPLGTAVRATRTVTFAGLKPGLLELEAQQYVGEVHVADVGVPLALLREMGQVLPRA